jgi:hypothetical protein
MPALKEPTMLHRPSASLVRFVTLSALILGCLMEHHTLAEFTFNTDFYDFDWDKSHARVRW